MWPFRCRSNIEIHTKARKPPPPPQTPIWRSGLMQLYPHHLLSISSPPPPPPLSPSPISLSFSLSLSLSLSLFPPSLSLSLCISFSIIYCLFDKQEMRSIVFNFAYMNSGIIFSLKIMVLYFYNEFMFLTWP